VYDQYRRAVTDLGILDLTAWRLGNPASGGYAFPRRPNVPSIRAECESHRRDYQNADHRPDSGANTRSGHSLAP
jgi:hypothetical protein